MNHDITDAAHSIHREEDHRMTRRTLLAVSAQAALSVAGGAARTETLPDLPEATYRRLPRWRGFNLLEKFTLQRNAPYREEDLDLMAEWGFDFIRLPCDYRCWTEAPGKYRENVLRDIDHVIELARKRHIHVNLNLHRAPGYCVNPPKEPLDLWADDAGGVEARAQFAAQWGMLAARYKGIPARNLSFDLLNEPGMVSAATYRRAVEAAVEAIRAADRRRLIVADGIEWGNRPVPDLVNLEIAQSTRGYTPMQVSHYRASWVQGADRWPEPTWPMTGEAVWDKERLRRERIRPWKELEARGVGVHVGEWGAHNLTPHAVVLAWMRDCLALWKEAGWGWALWNLRGSFGVLDSGRTDVAYEDFRGHKLDRAMLEVLRAG